MYFFDLVKKGIVPAIINEGGIVSQLTNYGLFAGNDMSLTHDYWAQNTSWIKNTGGMTQISIVPAYIYNTYGLIGKPFNMLGDYLNSKLIENLKNYNDEKNNQ